MPKIVRSALIQYSAEQMYQLVNDVSDYQNFLPGCAQSEVLEEREDYMKASLLVRKGGISQRFTTENQLVKNRQINMSLADGPFKSLHGGWVFTPLGDEACKIELNLEFEFSNRLIGLAFGKVFNQLTANMVDAFTTRAREVYA